MSEQVVRPELLTITEAERRLAVGNALNQLNIVRTAFADGQIQPQMSRECGEISTDFLPGRGKGFIIAPRLVDDEHGRFSLICNHAYSFSSPEDGFEIDATEEHMTFKIGKAFENNDSVELHHPMYPRYAAQRAATLKHQFSIEQVLEEKLPLNYTDTFIKLSNKALKYVVKRLIKPSRR